MAKRKVTKAKEEEARQERQKVLEERRKALLGTEAIKEKDPTEKGEAVFHKTDAIEAYNKLQGTPVDETTLPETLGEKESKEYEEAQKKKQGYEIPSPSGMPRIILIVPILSVSFEFFQSFVKFWSEMQVHCQGKYEIGYHFIYRKPVHMAETMGVEIAKYNKCTHVLFMDDDIYDIKPEFIDMLLAADKDVIAGVMYASGFPYAMCTFRKFVPETTVTSQPVQNGIYRLYEIQPFCPSCQKKGQLVNLQNWATVFCPICRQDLKDLAVQPVDLIPFCFTMIKTSVFDRIRKPWFHCNTLFPTDSWFADRCSEAGIQQYAHMMIRLNHAGITDFTRQFRLNEGMELSKQKHQAIILTPSEMEIHRKMMEEMMANAELRAKYKEQPQFKGGKK